MKCLLIGRLIKDKQTNYRGRWKTWVFFYKRKVHNSYLVLFARSMPYQSGKYVKHFLRDAIEFPCRYKTNSFFHSECSLIFTRYNKDDNPLTIKLRNYKKSNCWIFVQYLQPSFYLCMDMLIPVEMFIYMGTSVFIVNV